MPAPNCSVGVGGGVGGSRRPAAAAPKRGLANLVDTRRANDKEKKRLRREAHSGLVSKVDPPAAPGNVNSLQGMTRVDTSAAALR